MLIPFKKFKERLAVSKDDSDFNYFFDLLLLGEFLTKIVTLGLVSAIVDDKERSR